MRKSITTILFDFGDVLIKDTTKVLEKKYDFDSMTKTNQKKYVQAFHNSEIGKIPTKELMNVMHKTLVADMTPKEIENYILHSKLLPPWRLALKLKKLGYRIIIFSNNQKTWPKKFALYLHANFLQFPFINSAKLGIRKPHQDMYRYLLTHYKIDPSEAIFIDDREKNLLPAQKLGIKTFHYTQNYKELVQYLKKSGIY